MNIYFGSFPISINLFATLSIPNLSDNQIQQLFEKLDKIKLLQSPQLEQCIERVNLEALRRLTSHQIQSLDINNTHLITKARFKAIVESHIYKNWDIPTRRININMRHLTPDQIIIAFNRGLFNTKTAQLLSDEHVESLDFSQLDVNQAGGVDVISAIFLAADSKNRISLVKNHQLLNVLPHIQPQVLEGLIENQIAMLDFKNMQWIQKNHFEYIVGKDNYPNWDIYARRSNVNMQYLTTKQIEDCLNKGFFDPKSSKLLTDEQVHD